MKLPQLSLRDLFWLVLVCGMGFGWLADRRSSNTRIVDGMVRRLERNSTFRAVSGGVVTNDGEVLLIEVSRVPRAP